MKGINDINDDDIIVIATIQIHPSTNIEWAIDFFTEALVLSGIEERDNIYAGLCGNTLLLARCKEFYPPPHILH